MIRRLADIYDRLVQKLVLVVFYYIPIARACLTPNYRGSDIREEHAGTCSFASGRHAVYVLWQPKTIPWYVLNMLEALKRHQVNTTVVSNEKLSPEQLATLKPLCAEVLVRGNKGFDFGAYKDAVLRLMKDKASVSRLLILNDSVYVFRRGLDDLLDALLSEDTPIVAAHENWEKHYHFQSFCLGLSGELLRDPKVEKFWRQYRPISIRRWCIDQGEVKLSLAIRKAAASFKVVYSINDLLDVLSHNADWATLLQYKEFVPAPVAGELPQGRCPIHAENFRSGRAPGRPATTEGAVVGAVHASRSIAYGSVLLSEVPLVADTQARHRLSGTVHRLRGRAHATRARLHRGDAIDH